MLFPGRHGHNEGRARDGSLRYSRHRNIQPDPFPAEEYDSQPCQDYRPARRRRHDGDPCGPDTEMFYDTGKPACSDNCQPSCDCGKYVEIWNNVFMEYFKDKSGYSKLKQRNVDTGLGLERMAMLMQGKGTPFDTELFKPVMDKLKELQNVDIIESRRLVAEHLRSSIMIISDGGRPSNLDRGYVLRRLIRRMIRHMNKLQIDLNNLSSLVDINVETLNEMYPELEKNKETIKSVIIEEKDKFVKTLVNGEREFQKEINKLNGSKTLSGQVVFKLYDTYGFPPEVTKELAEENGYEVDLKEFEKLFKEHQEKSRAGSEAKFKGGLAEQTEETKEVLRGPNGMPLLGEILSGGEYNNYNTEVPPTEQIPVQEPSIPINQPVPPIEKPIVQPPVQVPSQPVRQP